MNAPARRMLVAVTTAVLAATAAPGLADPGDADLAEVRAATAAYHRVERAQADGWDLVPGLDHCFDNPGVGAMGYHYIDTGLLDLELDPRRPEALVYAPDRHGRLQLAAVEWIVPAGPWDATGASEPPMVLGRHTHLNEALGVYVLHAWVFDHNPAGTFADWNPRVRCP